METFQGKTAIVTGGGSDIGRAIATALLSEGANVVIASRRALSVENAASIACDVRKKADVVKVAEAAKQRFEKIGLFHF